MKKAKNFIELTDDKQVKSELSMVSDTVLKGVLENIEKGEAFSSSRVESNKALVNLIGDMGQIKRDTRSGTLVSKILTKWAEQSEIYLPKIDDKLDCYFVSRLARGLTRLNQQPEPSFHDFMVKSTIQLHKSGAFDAYLA